MKCRICIFGNGELDSQLLAQIYSQDFVIGVDYGAYWLLKHKIIPQVAIGDFDSVTKAQTRIIERKIRTVKKYQAEKDQTDMELAVNFAISKKPAEIVLYGALGKRLDQTLANIGLLEKIADAGIQGWIKDTRNAATVVIKGNTSTCLVGRLSESEGRQAPLEQKVKPAIRSWYVSIIPLTKTATVTLQGFKYPLNAHQFSRGQTLGISNELTSASGKISVKEGKVLVIESQTRKSL